MRVASLGTPVVPPVGWRMAGSSARAAEATGPAAVRARSAGRDGVAGASSTGFQRPSRRAFIGYSQRIGAGSIWWMPTQTTGAPADSPPASARAPATRGCTRSSATDTAGVVCPISSASSGWV